MSLIPKIRLLSTNSKIVSDQVIEFSSHRDAVRLLIRDFFGDNKYSGQRLIGLRIEFPGDDFSFCEALLNADQLKRLIVSLNELVAIAEQTYSDKQRTISNPFGSGRIGRYFNDLLIGYRAKKAIISKEFTVSYEFGIKGASIDLRYNSKYDEAFIVLTFWFTSLSHIMRIMSIEHAKLFASSLERQIEVAQGLS